MNDGELLSLLQLLEVELHQLETRRNRDRLRNLLHPDFEECGRSGRRYSREEVLSEFSRSGDLPPVISRDFRVSKLDECSALLTYVSAHVDASGVAHRLTLRSSLWLKTAAGWQMRFHQGTPTT